MTVDEGLRAVLDATVEALTPGLESLELPPSLARRHGRWRDDELVLETQVWRGEGWERVVVARTVGPHGVVTATVIALPEDGFSHEVVGFDLIAFGGRLSLAAVDLAPLDDAHFAAHARPRLQKLHDAAARWVIERRSPAFAKDTFSPEALIVAERNGAAGALLDPVAEFARSLAGFPVQRAHDASPALERKDQWKRAMNQNRKEMEALSRLFGAAWVREYVDLVLFPQREVTT
jgi:hypothetical protein